jgi:protein-tyrosine phosphatase
MSHDADQIIPQLWLGNFNSSQNIDFIRRNQISVIVNCTKDLPFLYIDGIYKYRIPVHDNLQSDEIISMTKWIRKILPIIKEHYQNGRSILIHCAAGMQRSAIVVLSFLYTYFSVDPKTALIKIRVKRPIAFMPYMNFGQSFKMSFGENAYNVLVS